MSFLKTGLQSYIIKFSLETFIKYWFIMLSVQTFQPLIVMNKRGNFSVCFLGMFINLFAIVLSPRYLRETKGTIRINRIFLIIFVLSKLRNYRDFYLKYILGIILIFFYQKVYFSIVVVRIKAKLYSELGLQGTIFHRGVHYYFPFFF